MSEYMMALKKMGYDVWELENGDLQVYLTDACRWWTEEFGGFDPDMGGGPAPICATISSDKRVQLIDSQEGHALEIPPIRFENPGHLLKVLQHAKIAFSDGTSLAEGTKIIDALLS